MLKPFTSCLLFQVQPAGESLKVNRLKWQSWTLLHSPLMESGEQVKDKTAVWQQPAPYLSNHLCHLIPLALCHRDASKAAVIFYFFFFFWGLCCGVPSSDGWCTIEWRSTSSCARGGVCTMCVCALSSAASSLSPPGGSSHLSWFSLEW